MEIVTAIAHLRDLLDDHRCAGRSVGLVPTMGYLHDGHGSLMRRSAAENDVTVSTVFVNPLQFAPGEDLDAYPRDPDGDAAKAEEAGTDLLFMPDHDEMYPTPVETTVSVGGIAAPLEGVSRPTFFDGVAVTPTRCRPSSPKGGIPNCAMSIGHPRPSPWAPAATCILPYPTPCTQRW